MTAPQDVQDTTALKMTPPTPMPHEHVENVKMQLKVTSTPTQTHAGSKDGKPMPVAGVMRQQGIPRLTSTGTRRGCT